jgi:hypothetical protein
MHHPRLFKPESIANVQIEIQIVDTHETLEPRIVIGLQAFDYQINRTLLIGYKQSFRKQWLEFVLLF